LVASRKLKTAVLVVRGNRILNIGTDSFRDAVTDLLVDAKSLKIEGLENFGKFHGGMIL
jgi:hypothetical protein